MPGEKSIMLDDKILMIGDPFLNFTKAIGADVDKSARGLGIRSNRYTMLVDNLKIVKLQGRGMTLVPVGFQLPKILLNYSKFAAFFAKRSTSSFMGFPA